ncbi:unnamed protein product, partial [Chrysoparadoxa australica]
MWPAPSLRSTLLAAIHCHGWCTTSPSYGSSPSYTLVTTSHGSFTTCCLLVCLAVHGSMICTTKLGTSTSRSLAAACSFWRSTSRDPSPPVTGRMPLAFGLALAHFIKHNGRGISTAAAALKRATSFYVFL